MLTLSGLHCSLPVCPVSAVPRDKGPVQLPLPVLPSTEEHQEHQHKSICENTLSKQATIRVSSSYHCILTKLSCTCRTTGEVFFHLFSFLMLTDLILGVNTSPWDFSQAGKRAFPPANRPSWHYVMLQTEVHHFSSLIQ